MLSHCYPDAVRAFQIVVEQFQILNKEYTILYEFNNDLKTYIQNEINFHIASSCPCSPAGYNHELKVILDIYTKILDKINLLEKSLNE